MKFLRDYRDLLTYKILADARSESRQLYMGFAWWIIEPAAHMLVLYLIFGLILERGGPGFVGFLLVGFVFWRWIDSSIKRAAQSLMQARGILTQSNLPKWLFPLSDVLSAGLRFAVVLVLLTIFAVLYTGKLSAAYLYLPGLILLNLCFIFAVGLVLSLVVPYFPDARKLIDNAFQLLFFASGIFFDISRLDANIAQYLYWNPIAVFLSAYRKIMLDGVSPELASLTVPIVCTTLFLLLAVSLYRFLDQSLAKALLR